MPITIIGNGSNLLVTDKGIRGLVIKIDIKKLKIEKTKKSNDTVTRTIRISGETFDKISDLAEKNELSFNSVVNQIIEFGLKNLEE